MKPGRLRSVPTGIKMHMGENIGVNANLAGIVGLGDQSGHKVRGTLPGGTVRAGNGRACAGVVNAAPPAPYEHRDTLTYELDDGWTITSRSPNISHTGDPKHLGFCISKDGDGHGVIRYDGTIVTNSTWQERHVFDFGSGRTSNVVKLTVRIKGETLPDEGVTREVYVTVWPGETGARTGSCQR